MANPKGNGRMMRINLIGAEGSKPEKNGFSGRRLLCAGAATLGIAAAGCNDTMVDLTPPQPSACEETAVSTRCDIDTPTHKRCMVYDGTAVEMDGYLFTASDVAPAGRAADVDYEVRDRLLDCESTGHSGPLRMSEEVEVSLGSQTYTLRAPTVVSASGESPEWAMLEVEKETEPVVEPPECPDISTRCEHDTFGSTCEVREGKAMEYDGYLWQVEDISLDYGTGAFKLTIIDPESDCGVVGILAGMHEGTTGHATVGGFNYSVEAKRVQAEDDPKWALMRVSREVSYCEAVDIPLECEVGTDSGLDSIRCPLYTNMGAIKFENVMWSVDRIYMDPTIREIKVDLKVYDERLGCSPLGGRTVTVPGTSDPIEYGIYRYQATVINADPTTGVADVRITRELKMCGGTETNGILNVGEVLSTAGGYKLRLDDVARDGNSGVFTVLDSSDREMTSFVLGRSETLFLSPLGMQVRVNEVAAGLLLASKWADVTIVECE